MTDIVERVSGAITREHAIPRPVSELPVRALSIKGRTSPTMSESTAARIVWDRETRLNNVRVNDYELIRWCDEVLGHYTGEQLAKARKYADDMRGELR